MSREIKFRGRHKLDGKWVVGNLIKMFGGWCIQNPDSENDIYIVDPETIGQYTGLKDKNGIRIYEKDVLICKLNKPAVVVYLSHQASFKINFGSNTMYDLVPDIDLMRVIGNILENPELLEAK